MADIQDFSIKKSLFASSLILLPIGFWSFFIDQQTAVFFRDHQPGLMRDFAKITTDVGMGVNYFSFFLIVLIFSFLPKLKPLKWLRDFSILGFWSLILSGILVYPIKYLVGRQRPYVTDNFEAFVFSPLSSDWQFHSLPSGHAQVLFTGTAVIWIFFPKLRFLSALWAILFAWTRVATHNHFVSDVCFGAWFGIAGTLLAVALVKRWPRLYRG